LIWAPFGASGRVFILVFGEPFGFMWLDAAQYVAAFNLGLSTQPSPKRSLENSEKFRIFALHQELFGAPTDLHSRHGGSTMREMTFQKQRSSANKWKLHKN